MKSGEKCVRGLQRKCRDDSGLAYECVVVYSSRADFCKVAEYPTFVERVKKGLWDFIGFNRLFRGLLPIS